MSTRVVRSIPDFLRHRMDVEVVCCCGHKALLDRWAVNQRFSAAGWSTCLLGGMLDNAYLHFRCTRCGARPVRIGPGYR